jgi:leucyl aminopeptidase
MQVQAPSLQFHFAATPLAEWSGDCLILGCCQTDGVAALPEAIATLDRAEWGGVVAEAIEETEFRGKVGTAVSTRLGGKVRKLVLVGLGASASLTAESLRRGAAAGLRAAHALKARRVALQFEQGDLPANSSLEALLEGTLLVAHRDNRFKTAGDNGSLEFAVKEVAFLGMEPDIAVLSKAEAVATGTMLARELVAAPANVVTPQMLATAARDIADTYGLELEVLDRAACEARGMGAFLGVAQASDLPPQFIHLTYRPAGQPRRKLALIGKGVTFDSGGLNLKTSMASIAMMKTDMGGAAAVLGAAHAIAALKPDTEVHFIVAATENMISGKALHPGDILTASNRKTIEINNTDAEGRLTLADALVFAEQLGVDAIVDLATLTGAIVIALGNQISGLFTLDETLAAELKAAADRSGEKIWQMPMEDSYGDSLKSVVADMKNTGSREGGSISAALFLKKFVEKTPWAHLDIAGTVWTEKDVAYNNAGATGYGVRTLVEWVLS